jgi:hypothetical protein
MSSAIVKQYRSALVAIKDLQLQQNLWQNTSTTRRHLCGKSVTKRNTISVMNSSLPPFHVSHTKNILEQNGISSETIINSKYLPSHRRRCISTTAVHLSESKSTPASTESSNLPSLLASISSDTIATIRTLPEISEFLSNFENDVASKSTHQQATAMRIEGLQRASQVFQQYNPDGEEYKAVILLQIHTLIQAYSYSEALELLNHEFPHESKDGGERTEHNLKLKFDIDSERVKLMYLLGDFYEADSMAQDNCDLALRIDDSGLKQGAAMNSLAICKLASVGLEDVDVLRRRDETLIEHADAHSNANADTSIISGDKMDITEHARNLLHVASKMLHNRYQEAQQDPKIGLACATSYSNQGLAELIQNLVKSQIQRKPIPIDSAMKSWRQALNIFEELQSTTLNHDQIVFLHASKARVYCNMTWAILFSSSYAINSDAEPFKEDSLKLASEYAGLALKAIDEIGAVTGATSNGSKHLGRVLGLVASCYNMAGSAVTSEGLFQSAMDALNLNGIEGSSMDTSYNDPVNSIDARSVLFYYSKLCNNWEKRGGDAVKYQASAIEMNNAMVDSWKGKSSIYSGVSFIALGDMF